MSDTEDRLREVVDNLERMGPHGEISHDAAFIGAPVMLIACHLETIAAQLRRIADALEEPTR